MLITPLQLRANLITIYLPICPKNKKSSYKSSGGRQVMDLEVNKLIFHQKKATEKVDRRW